MRNLIIAVLAVFSISASAQNFNCFQPGVKNYFINGNNYVRGIRIDSVAVNGGDTVYYPYRTQRISDYVYGAGIVDTFGASWLGKNVIKHTDGTFVLDNYWDTVFIKTKAHTGDSWIFFNDTTDISYIANVVGEDTMTILGILDSIKKITINADSTGVPYTIDPVNNFQIILSKNHGFVQVFDLYTFPFHKPLGNLFHLPNVNIIRWYDYYLDVLLDNLGTGDLPSLDHQPDTLNSVFHLIPFHCPTLMEIYDFAVGDVYESQYEEVYSSPFVHRLYTLDSITSKTLTAYNVSYGGTEHEKSVNTDYASTPPVSTTTYTSGLYIGGGDTSLLVDPKHMPEEWNSGYLLHYFTSIPSVCEAGDSYQIDYDYHGGGFVILDMSTVASYSYTTYSAGHGVTYSTVGIQYPGMPRRTSWQTYFRKNGINCGSFQDIMPTGINRINLFDKISVVPNPAADQISILSDGLFSANFKITVYDITGKYILKTNADGLKNTLTINTSSWSDGLYMVVIQDNAGIVKKEKIVVQH